MKLSFAVVLVLLTATAGAQGNAEEALRRGTSLWEQRLANSAIAALDIAAGDPGTAAAAQEALGRIYTFKGWQQESVFPGWHDEPAFRDRALAALRAAVAADPQRASAREALRLAESFAASAAVPPAPPRPEIVSLDARIEA